MKKRTSPFRSLVEKSATFLYNERKIITVIALVSFFIFASLEFFFLRNWDMLVRILNANYLFHSGYYFQPETALLESLIIGLFSYPLGNYAVYAFIGITVLTFVFSIKEFASAFNSDFYLTLLLLMSPFIIFYGIKNGSDLFVISFIILFIAYVKKKSPLSGLFMGLAFLSKYYSILFFPIIFFMLRKNRKDITNFLLAILILIAVLTPYFIYNFLEFGNFIFTFAMSFLDFTVEVSSSMPFVYTGLEELIVPAIALVILSITRKSRKIKKILSLDTYILFVGLIISAYLYYASNWLMVGGLGAFRFALPTLVFSSLILSRFLKKEDIIWLAPFFAISLVIAIFIMEPMIPQTGVGEFKAAVSAFSSVYNTTNCTASSDFWVDLNYYGLPAESSVNYSGNYSGTPIVNLNSVNTTYPLVYHNSTYYSRIFIYGGNYCTYHKVIIDFLTQHNTLFENGSSVAGGSNISANNANFPYKNLPISACYWLFSTKYKIEPFYLLCNYINGAFEFIKNR